ncbi:hypothetical protein Q0O45_13155, partial [Staphylococcus aureus]|nr:hypothetical protein [Staphylococcus aureus]
LPVLSLKYLPVLSDAVFVGVELPLVDGENFGGAVDERRATRAPPGLALFGEVMASSAASNRPEPK